MDKIDIGSLELIQHLAGLCRKALHVLSIALGIQRIEGQRGLSGPARTGNHDELTAGYPNLEVLKVMLPSALDVNVRRRFHAVPDKRRRTGDGSKYETSIDEITG